MLLWGFSTQSSVGLSLGSSRGWRSCTKASLEMGGVTQRGSSNAQVSRNPEWLSRESKVWGYGEKGVELRERASPLTCSLTCCRSKCFIPVGEELACTPSLTLVVPRDMAETYVGRATAMTWGGGMGRHAALMGMDQATSCSGTFTSDSRSDVDLVSRADVASSEVLS
ncbi:hypothetical protein B296_00055148 [Ensete ventricosum]|uniref:Uncharacterized protein n=1 Tax=Ensete ventricosum TaxID=4639 RepID=A0A426X628_ENSVE|nr:hypothetical protein B296_00055148 [Ensete ventricosum]